MSTFKIKMKDGWKDNKEIKFQGYNFMAMKEIIENTRSSLEYITEWVRPVMVHNDPIILISGGFIDTDKIKQLMIEKPNAKILCVKHALPILAKANIKPWACIILDTRSINEVSSLGKNRIELIKSAPQETIFFAMARVHPSYFLILQEMRVRVVGFNNHYNELAGAFNIETEELIKNGKYAELYNELYNTMTLLPSSCAAVCAINLAILLGFREVHLFGYDACVKSPKDTEDECFEVETNGKMYYVPKEFTSLGKEFSDIFKSYPHELNVQFYHYTPDSFIGGIFISSNIIKLDTLENTLKSLKKIPDKFCKIIENYNTKGKGYINKRIYEPDITLMQMCDLETYTFAQKCNSGAKCNNIYTTEENIEIISKYIINKINGRKAICHGVGLGYELTWFSMNLENLDIIGTDIAKDVIEKKSDYMKNKGIILNIDYNELLVEWIDAFDIIYTNSLNHTYDPQKTLDYWMSSLKDNGRCFIEMNVINKAYSTSFEPFSITIKGFKELVKDLYDIDDILELNDVKTHNIKENKYSNITNKRVCIVLKKKK